MTFPCGNVFFSLYAGILFLYVGILFLYVRILFAAQDLLLPHRNVHKFSFQLSLLKISKCKILHQSHIVELPQLAESASVYFGLVDFEPQKLLAF